MEIMYDIFTNVTTNSTSSYQTMPVGGRFLLEVDGTWNGATVTFTTRGRKGNAITATDTSGSTISFSASGQKLVEVSPYEEIAGTVANAGASTSLSACLRRVPYSA